MINRIFMVLCMLCVFTLGSQLPGHLWACGVPSGGMGYTCGCRYEPDYNCAYTTVCQYEQCCARTGCVDFSANNFCVGLEYQCTRPVSSCWCNL